LSTISAARLFGVLAVLALLGSASSPARADTIGLADFGPTAVLTDLDNIGDCCGAAFAAPLTVGIYTFTTDDGVLRYNAIGFNNSPNLADNTDLGFIDIAIAPGANVTKFGFLVGLAGEAQHHKETVSFFDTNNILLGSIGVSRDGGFEFVGWENPAGFIGRVLITDTDLNSTVVGVDNLIVEAVPVPPALPLFASGLAALGLLGWRRKRKAILAIQ
jgi:hypothetical protein